MRCGRDAGELFAESIRELDEAAATGKEAGNARLWRGLARLLWGISATMPPWGGSSGRDPRSARRRRDRRLRDAVTAEPEAPDGARTWRGAAYILQSIVQTTRLADPSDSYERALADLGEAIRRNPSDDEAWMWRGIARKLWAIREFLGRRDPQPAYESALGDFNEAIRRNPRRVDSWTHRGEARMLWANFAMPSRGEDPFPVMERSIRDFDESIRLNPSQGLVWSSRGSAREACGRLLAARAEAGAEAWYGAARGGLRGSAAPDPGARRPSHEADQQLRRGPPRPLVKLGEDRFEAGDHPVDALLQPDNRIPRRPPAAAACPSSSSCGSEASGSSITNR
jgi:tetratricopeptide (TPR) repeat protein